MGNAETIDQAARRTVFNEHADIYGKPENNFAIIAEIWSALLQVKITAEQVALMMTGMKLARLVKTPHHRDSQIDVIGYMLCLEQLQKRGANDLSAMPRWWQVRSRRRNHKRRLGASPVSVCDARRRRQH